MLIWLKLSQSSPGFDTASKRVSGSLWQNTKGGNCLRHAKMCNKPQSNALRSKQSNQEANKRPKAVHDSCEGRLLCIWTFIACLPGSPGREKCNPMAHLHTKPFDCGPKAARRWLQMAHKQLQVWAKIYLGHLGLALIDWQGENPQT